jgi:O-antigen/teichoic acid export membrane protein
MNRTRYRWGINFSWSLLGNLFYTFSQWLMLILLTKLGSPELVGQFALSLAVVVPIMTFANLQLASVLVTDQSNQFPFGQYLSTRLASVFLAVFVVVVLVISVPFPNESRWIIVFMALAKGIEAVSDLCIGLLQKNERIKHLAFSRFLKGFLSLAAFSTAIWLTGDLRWAVLGLGLAWLCVLVLYDIRQAKQHEAIVFSFQPRAAWRLIRVAFPLGVVFLLAALSTNIPRFVIERFLGEAELGYFTAVAYLLIAGTTLMNALREIAAPRLAKLISDDNRSAFGSLILRLTLFALFIGGCGWLLTVTIGDWILSILYTQEYSAYVHILELLVLGAILDYAATVLGFALTAARKFSIQPYLASVWTICTVLGSILFIPSHGLIGAAVVAIAANGIRLICTGLVVRRIVRG